LSPFDYPLTIKEVDLPRRTVLLVEDEADLRRLYADALKSAGLHVREAADGTDALLVMDDVRPDAIVLDLWLPMLDGMSVADEIASSSHTRDIPIIVVTGTSGDVSGVKAVRVLRKPIDPVDLIAAVRDAVGG
jgi:CheY-like chemotaxis protein